MAEAMKLSPAEQKAVDKEREINESLEKTGKAPAAMLKEARASEIVKAGNVFAAKIRRCRHTTHITNLRWKGHLELPCPMKHGMA